MAVKARSCQANRLNIHLQLVVRRVYASCLLTFTQIDQEDFVSEPFVPFVPFQSDCFIDAKVSV